MAPVFESVADAIGGTPLFRLRGLRHGIAASPQAARPTQRRPPSWRQGPARTHGVSATEVIGSFCAARLAADLAAGRVQGDDLISGYADSPPPTIGAGQSVHDALAAFGPAGADSDTVLVLRDGRAHAILTRAALLSPAEQGRRRV